MPDADFSSNNEAVFDLTTDELVDLLIASGMSRTQAENTARSQLTPAKVLEQMLTEDRTTAARATRVLGVVTGGAMEGTQESYKTWLETDTLTSEGFRENSRVLGFDYSGFNETLRTTNGPSAEFKNWSMAQVLKQPGFDVRRMGPAGVRRAEEQNWGTKVWWDEQAGMARKTRSPDVPKGQVRAFDANNQLDVENPLNTETKEDEASTEEEAIDAVTGEDPLAGGGQAKPTTGDAGFSGSDPMAILDQFSQEQDLPNYGDPKVAAAHRAAFNSSRFQIGDQFLDTPGQGGVTLGSTNRIGITRLGIDPGDLGIDPNTFWTLSGGMRPSRTMTQQADTSGVIRAEAAVGNEGVPGLSWNQARQVLFRLPESEVENLQRHLWQMGYYGDERILSGQVPKFGFLEQDTIDAYMNFIGDVFADESLDSGVVSQRRVRMFASVHEQAAATALQSNANLQAPFMSQFTRQADASLEESLQRNAEAELGRILTPDELAARKSQFRQRETTFAESDFAISEQMNQVSSAFQGSGPGTAGGSQTIPRDSMGYAIGEFQGSEGGAGTRAVVPFSPSGTVSNPGEGLTEANIQAVLRAIRWGESGDPNGVYTAKNKRSSAGGAYQFVDATWIGAGGSATQGGGQGNGFASYASPQEQDRIARNEVIRLYNQYGSWERVFMAWFLPSWIGVREDTAVPGHGGLTLRQYAERGMDRAFGRQAQQLGPPPTNQERDMEIRGLLSGSRTMPIDYNNDAGQPLHRDQFETDPTGAMLDAMAGGGLYYTEQLDPEAELARSVQQAFPEEAYGHQIANQFANFRRLLGGNY